jgi:Lrp/AsnC family leucine-responsive transcriptional regulator
VALSIGPNIGQHARMDRFDALILNAIQENARTTADKLAAHVGLSADACRKRLAKLRASGIIEAEIAIVTPEAVGRDLLLIVEVSLQNEKLTDIDAFKARMLAAPEVMQCYYVTGDADFVLILSATSMADYEAFTRRQFFADENILKFRTSAVMDRVKAGFALPVKAS